jgi:hypothetical protein
LNKPPSSLRINHPRFGTIPERCAIGVMAVVWGGATAVMPSGGSLNYRLVAEVAVLTVN